MLAQVRLSHSLAESLLRRWHVLQMRMLLRALLHGLLNHLLLQRTQILLRRGHMVKVRTARDPAHAQRQSRAEQTSHERVSS